MVDRWWIQGEMIFAAMRLGCCERDPVFLFPGDREMSKREGLVKMGFQDECSGNVGLISA